MADYSTILQTPQIRALIQENLLEKQFHDALFPKQLFRESVTASQWPAIAGDTMLMTGTGLLTPNLKALVPGTDPTPSTYDSEQWPAQLNTYANSIDTHMPTSVLAIASLFMENAKKLGMNAGQTMNRNVRNRMYNAALSGWTVADGAQTTVTTLRVKRLNGLTRARRPDLVGGSPVTLAPVSSANPLGVKIFDNTGPSEVSRTITGFTADVPGDEIGPGTVTLNSAVTVSDRAYVFADDRTNIIRVGGGNKVDDVGSSDLMTLGTIRQMVARLRQMNVPEMADGTYHMHCDPTTEAQLFADPEFQRLNRGLPDGHYYQQFAIGTLLGCTLFRNTECPQVDTVVGGLSATFSQNDPFAGELYNTGINTGVKIHRPILAGGESIFEYYQDLNSLITEAGITGKVATSTVVNNGIEVNTDRVQLIMRAPLNRLQDMVSTTWRFVGEWVCRTDYTAPDPARFKRFIVAESGE